MPSSGVIKPKILDSDKQENFVWEATHGMISHFPSMMEGDNLFDVGYALDRAMQLYVHNILSRVDVRHVSDETVESLNSDELNDRLNYMGVPFIPNDTSKAKKRRLRTWWEKNLGGGTVGTIKYTIYDLIGSGVFFNYDTQAGKDDPVNTSRVLLVNPSSGSQWGDFGGVYYTSWDDITAGSGAVSGTWGDFSTIGKTTLDFQIYYGSLGDFYNWEQPTKRADIYYMTEKIKPIGLIYTINNIYDGAVSDYKLVYRFDRDGTDDITGNSDVDLSNNLNVTGTVHTDGIIQSGVLLDGATNFLSGVIMTEVMSGTSASYSCWMKYITAIGTNDTLVATRSGTDQTNDQVMIRALTNWSDGIQGMVGDGTLQTLHAQDFTGGSWFNIIVTADGSTGNYVTYVNNDAGTTVDGTFTELALVSGTHMWFGRSGTTLPANVKGDNFMLWNRLLTSAERLEIYEAGTRFL